mmetsp:Transcript_25429/g.57273  ORF Transcript_25429/g.57273 Transcript_25429/m.57273 type:complete len:232 (-) Transcript_25429:53-748(-)
MSVQRRLKGLTQPPLLLVQLQRDSVGESEHAEEFHQRPQAMGDDRKEERNLAYPHMLEAQVKYLQRAGRLARPVNFRFLRTHADPLLLLDDPHQLPLHLFHLLQERVCEALPPMQVLLLVQGPGAPPDGLCQCMGPQVDVSEEQRFQTLAHSPPDRRQGVGQNLRLMPVASCSPEVEVRREGGETVLQYPAPEAGKAQVELGGGGAAGFLEGEGAQADPLEDLDQLLVRLV